MYSLDERRSNNPLAKGVATENRDLLREVHHKVLSNFCFPYVTVISLPFLLEDFFNYLEMLLNSRLFISFIY